MVFDWFKRSLAPQGQPQPDSEASAVEPSPGSGSAEPAAGDDRQSSQVGPEPVPSPEPAEPLRPAEAPVVRPAEDSSTAPAAIPDQAAAASSPSPAAPAAGVDQDALAWARQAYARLKAQQEAAAQEAGGAGQVAAAPEPEQPAVPVAAPAVAAAAPAVEPVAPAVEPVAGAPVVAETPVVPAAAPVWVATVAPSLPPPPPEVPPASAGAVPAAAPVPPAGSSEPSAVPPSSASAFAGQQQAVVPPAVESPAAPAAPADAAGVPTPAQAPPAFASDIPAPESPRPLSLLERAAAQRQQRRQEILDTAAAAAELPAAAEAIAPATSAPAAPAAAEQVEPSLGAFDDDFTWSAEVLAAQGRKVEEVSLEEIDWLTRLRRGLEKTRKGFVAQLLDTLGDDPLSADTLEDIESSLLRADVGVQATDRVLEALRQRLNQEVVDPAEGLRFLKEQLRGILEEPITASGEGLLAPERGKLNVWLMVGVNGVGKTTTLGKLANLAVRSGYSCLIAAADTFRAAAVQQVSVWGERSGVPVVSNPSSNADPAAVVYDAIGAAKAKGTELVLVDTAGRLQTKHNLMEELSKVRRIVDKLAPEAVVESLLVLDASQGQNGLRQAMAFASAAGLTGVVITKLDGSARGGVALAVASEAGLPIRFVGAGETIRDLRPFNSFEFVEALLGS